MRMFRASSIVAVLVALALIGGCGSPAPAATPTTAPSGTAAKAPTTAPTPAATAAPTTAPQPTPSPKPAASPTASGVALGDLVAKAGKLTEYSYDMKMTAAGQTMAGKTYVKGMKIRQEMNVAGMQTLTLVDITKKVAYMVVGDQKTAMKLDFSQVMTQTERPADRVGSLPSSAKLVGTDTVDGKSAVVYEVPDQASQATSKMWIWTDRAVPLKIEVTTSAGKVSMDFTNYQFVAQPDSLFELPAGTQIVDMPTGLPGSIAPPKQ